MLEKMLCERIAAVFIKIVAALLEILSIDVEESIARIIACKEADKNLLISLNAVNLCDSETETSNVSLNKSECQLDKKRITLFLCAL
jgi:hypothetical protein